MAVKVVDHQKIIMSEQEFTYYKDLVTQFSTPDFSGEMYFKDLFKTDEDGFITIITPKQSIPWAIIFFIQQLMINQRLKVIDDFRKERSK